MKKLPAQLLAGASSVAIISRRLGKGTLAHRPGTRSRDVVRPGHGTVRQDYPVAACADVDPDPAYLVSAAWADHKGAAACTETTCFPNA